MQSIRVIYAANPLKFEHNFVSFNYVKNPQPLNAVTVQKVHFGNCSAHFMFQAVYLFHQFLSDFKTKVSDVS